MGALSVAKTLMRMRDSPLQQRPGSAPPHPHVDESMPRFPSPLCRFSSPHDAAALEATRDSCSSIRRTTLSDPVYVRFWLANKNINPRLPPPPLKQRAGTAWDASYKKFDANSARDQAIPLPSPLACQLDVKDKSDTADPATAPTSGVMTCLPSLSLTNIRTVLPSCVDGDRLAGVPWSARAGSASQQLDALLQDFSPRALSPLLSGGGSCTDSFAMWGSQSDQSKPDQPTPGSLSTPASETQNDPLVTFGATAHMRRSSGVQQAQQPFDVAVGSPVHSNGNAKSSPFASASLERACKQDNRPGLPYGTRVEADPPNPPAQLPLRSHRRQPAPSKLRISSTGGHAPDRRQEDTLPRRTSSTDSSGTAHRRRSSGGSETRVEVLTYVADASSSKPPGWGPVPTAGSSATPTVPVSIHPTRVDDVSAHPGNQAPFMHQVPTVYPYYTQQMMAAMGPSYPPYPGFMPAMMGYSGYPMMTPNSYMPPKAHDVHGMIPGMPGGYPMMGMHGYGRSLLPGMVPMMGSGPEWYGSYSMMEASEGSMGTKFMSTGTDGYERGPRRVTDVSSMDDADVANMDPRVQAHVAKPGGKRPSNRSQEHYDSCSGTGGGNGGYWPAHRASSRVRDPAAGSSVQWTWHAGPGRTSADGSGMTQAMYPVYYPSGGAADGRWSHGEEEHWPGANAMAETQQGLGPVVGGATLPSSAVKLDIRSSLGHVCSLCLDQHGSRLLQQQLEMSDPHDYAAVLHEVLPDLLMLSTDVFANYVVQKLLELGSPDQRSQMARMLSGSIVPLSLHMYGCRVVQKALELLAPQQQVSIANELQAQVLDCARDQNGNHVLQKVIERLPAASAAPLLDSLLPHIADLSCHPFGCRVVQRLLERCDRAHASRRRKAMDAILQSTLLLAQDQYGNYVVQHLLQLGTARDREHVALQMSTDLSALSMHKFSSNVVEKCLTLCSASDREMLVSHMLSKDPGQGEEKEAGAAQDSGGSGPEDRDGDGDGDGDGAPSGQQGQQDVLVRMMTDPYGNFVVQKALDACSSAQRDLLLQRLQLQLPTLRRLTYGKHIVTRLERLMQTAPVAVDAC